MTDKNPMTEPVKETMWHGDNVVYMASFDAYRFEADKEYLAVEYLINIPEDVNAFSFSLKIGNDYTIRKIGYQDYAVVSVGYIKDEISFEIVKSSYIQNEQNFIVLTLGNEQSPLPLEMGANKMFVRIEAYNATDDKMDLAFGKPIFDFCNYQLSQTNLSNYNYYNLYRFEKNITDQNVLYENTNNLPTLPLLLLIGAILGIKFWYRKSKAKS